MNIKQIYNILSSLVFKNKTVYAHFAVTHRCNLNCSFCNKSDEYISNELNIGQISAIAQYLRKKGIFLISLSGGEAFLRNDLLDIVKIFSEYDIKVLLLTNALNADDDIVRRLNLIKNFYGLSISLHSMSEKTSLFFYNDPVIYRTIQNNIKKLIKIAGRKKVMINTVISPVNLDEIYDILKFAENEKAVISFLPVEHNNNGELMFKDNDILKLDRLYSFLIEESKKNKCIFNSTSFLQKSHKYQTDKKCHMQCHAGRLYISIDPKGNFAACHKYHTDDVLNFEFDIKNNIKCRDCMRPCWMEISNFFTDRYAFFQRLKKYIKR